MARLSDAELFTATVCAAWMAEADALSRRGLDEAARLMRSMATELGERATEWADQPVTLREAAEFGGYAYSTLEHRVRVGELPNAGEKGNPRLRRRDVPLKAESSRAPTRPASARGCSGIADRNPGSAVIEAELLALETKPPHLAPSFTGGATADE